MSEKTIAYFSDVAEGIPVPNVFLQWKGTDVCLDFRCSCGAEAHFDGFFCYAIKCAKCGALYEMPSTVALKRVESTEAVVQELPEEEEENFQ